MKLSARKTSLKDKQVSLNPRFFHIAVLTGFLFLSGCGGGSNETTEESAPNTLPGQPSAPEPAPTPPVGDNYAVQGYHQTDNTLPVAKNLTEIARDKNETEAAISWQLAVSDQTKNILIYRNGLFHKRYPATTLDNNQFIDHHLNPATSYNYQLRTENDQGVVSDLSMPITITTPSFPDDYPLSTRAFTRSYDMSYLNLNAHDCSQENNNQQSFGKIFYGQTHLVEPKDQNERITHRLDGSKLGGTKRVHRAGIAQGRATLVQVLSKGEGIPGPVTVEVFYNDNKVGEICLTPPTNLSREFPRALGGVLSQSLEHTYHGYLMPEWVRPGLSFNVKANNFIQTIPANYIRIEAPSLYHVVDIHAESKGTYNDKNSGGVLRLTHYKLTKEDTVFRLGYQWQSSHPSKDMVLTTFPIVLEAQPYRLANSAWHETGFATSTIGLYDWGHGASGVSSVGGGRASGFINVANHELGHATGIGHLGSKPEYPYGNEGNDTEKMPRPSPDSEPEAQLLQPMMLSTYHNAVTQYRAKGSAQAFGGDNDYFHRITAKNLTKWSRWDYNVKIPEKFQEQAKRDRGAWLIWQAALVEGQQGQYIVNPAQFAFNNPLPKQQDIDVINFSGIYSEQKNLSNLAVQTGFDLSRVDPAYLQAQNDRTLEGNKLPADFFYYKKGDLGILNHPVYYRGNYKFSSEEGNGDARSDLFLDKLRSNPNALCEKGCNIIANVEFEDGSKITRLLDRQLERIDPSQLDKKVKQANGVARSYSFYFATLDHGSPVENYELRELTSLLINKDYRPSNFDKLPATHIAKMSNDQVRALFDASKLLIKQGDFAYKEFLSRDDNNFVKEISLDQADFDTQAYAAEFRKKLFLPRIIDLPPADFTYAIHQQSINKDRIKASYIAPQIKKMRNPLSQYQIELLQEERALTAPALKLMENSLVTGKHNEEF